MSRIDYLTIALCVLLLSAFLFILLRYTNIESYFSRTPQASEIPVDAQEIDPPPSKDYLKMVRDSVLISARQEEEIIKEGSQEKPYLVVTASFPTEEQAQQERERMAKIGYQDCEIGFFNQGQIVSVIAGRFDDYQLALSFSEQINEKLKLKSYVHRKQLN